METPYVSFVIPFRDEESTLQRCVTSILNVKVPNGLFEIILANNKSRDNSLSIAQTLANSFPERIRVISNADMDGPGPTVNEAVSVARGAICARIDADGAVREDYLVEALRNFSDPTVALVIPKIEVRGRQNASILFEQDAPTRGHGFPIFRRDAFQAIGGYDARFVATLTLRRFHTTLFFREDTDLVLAFRDNGYKVVYEPRAVAYHDVYQTSPVLIAKWGLNHMMDPLLLKRHPNSARSELGTLAGPVTTWTLAFLITSLVLILFLYSALYLKSALPLIATVLIIEYLVTLVRLRRGGLRRLLSPFAFYFFLFFTLLGRIYGTWRFRKLLL